MSAARKRAFNGGSAWRGKAIAAIQICWKQISPGGDRDERLGWIAEYLGLRDLESITDLSDEQLGKVAGEMKSKVQGPRSKVEDQRSKIKDQRSNVIRGEFGRDLPPRPSATPPNQGGEPEHETVFLSSPEMVYTLEKLDEYIGWTAEHRNAFLQQRFKCSSFRMLTFKQATTAVNSFLRIAAHKDLKKLKGQDKPVSRAETNKYVPLLKEKLRIDR